MTEPEETISPRDGKIFKCKNSEKIIEVKKLVMEKGIFLNEIPGFTHKELVNGCVHLHSTSINYDSGEAFWNVLGDRSSYTVAAVVSREDAKANLFPYYKGQQSDGGQVPPRSKGEDLANDNLLDQYEFDEFKRGLEKRKRQALEMFGRRKTQPKRIADDLIGPEHQIVGCVTFHTLEIDGNDGSTFKYIEVDMLSVSPIYRGSGLGGYLLDHVMNIMDTEGYRWIQLNSSLRAVSLYKRKGFEGSLDKMMLYAKIAPKRRAATADTDDAPTAKRCRIPLSATGLHGKHNNP